MKKLIAVILVVCVAFGVAVSYDDIAAAIENIKNPTAAEADAQPDAAADEAAPVTYVDMEAVGKLHGMDDVIMTVGGIDVTWGDYMYFLNTNVLNMESQMQQLQMYGMNYKWTDPISSDGATIARYVVQAAEEDLKGFTADEAFVREQVPGLDEKNAGAIASEMEEIMANFGDDKAEAEKNLASQFLSTEMIYRLIGLNHGYNDCFDALYGENAEKIPDGEALAYLTDGGYMYATHILLLTKDMTSGEVMDDAAKAEKKQQLEALAAELRAIEDNDERVAAFAKYKAELCEDTGKAAYPNGYLFPAGTMVTEFEDCVNTLEEYQVSDVVETAYGYHIIMRLPFDADEVIMNENTSARMAMAGKAMAQAMKEHLDAMEIEYKNGFEVPELEKFLVTK